MIGAADLPTPIAAKLLTTSEGNPLFVVELVRMLVEEGALRREGERWVASAELAALEMPPTIHALLAARIERLRPEERGVLERAAVVGRHFSRSAVAALLSPSDVADLDARLEALRRSELIERDGGWWLGEPALRFHHVLIRDAAYRRVLKSTRAELHARFADWIEARAGDATEHDETIGWHLAQAHQHLRELGPLDARGVLLGTRAAQRLAAAGRRALVRDDLALAGSLLQRAFERLDPSDKSRADLALDCGEALLASGEVGLAAAVIEELGRLAVDSERLRAWHTCFMGELTALTAPQGLNATAIAVASAAETLAKLGDAAGEAKAHHVHALALARLGRVGGAEAALDRALAAARRAGDVRRANAVLAGAPLAALWGPSPVTRASGRCLDVVRVLRITQDAPAVEAVALSCQGVLEALRGRTDAARRMVASARKMVEELGVTQRVLEVDVFAARVDLLEGDAASAERLLRSAADGLRALGLGIDAARATALLGRALLAQGLGEEAEVLSHESEALAGDDLQAAIAWRCVRAEALAQRGEHSAAEALAHTAVEVASATDALLDHADALLALARVHRAAGRKYEASAAEARAIDLWEAKGATLLAEHVRSGALPESRERWAAPVGMPDTRAEAAPVLQRRVRPNAATAMATREPRYELEPLATLGERLALKRRHTGAGEVTSARRDVGTYENGTIQLLEADEGGLTVRVEIFDSDKLSDAIARLYARYAELLPEGAARARAEAIARSARVMLGQPDLAATATVLAASVEFTDLRTVGFGTLHGAASVIDTIGAMMKLSSDDVAYIDDVFVLEADALVVRWTNRGTDRATGGVFERKLCQLFTFGSVGLVTRWQQFEVEHAADALVRFDQLTAAAEPRRPPARRVRANPATRNIECFVAAVAAADAAALSLTFDESLHVVHHPTRATYGRREMMGTWRSAMRAAEFEFRQENLAALGDSLALERHFVSVEVLADANVQGFGRSEFHELAIFHVAGSSRVAIHIEIFAGAELSKAICGLYARYAESLPEGAARTRAEAIARSVAASLRHSNEPADLARYRQVLGSTFELVDHQVLGTWSARTADEHVHNLASWQGVATGAVFRTDDVRALDPDALLLARTLSGAASASGGAFERPFLVLFVFGSNGLSFREEYFDVGDETGALARLDELTRSAIG